MRGTYALLVTLALAPCGAFAQLPSVLISIEGTFQYEDRIWDATGYTGSAQILSIRRADVEVVRASDGAILGSGRTDASGDYMIEVDITEPTELYVRCLSATEDHPDYHVYVVDTFQRVDGTVDLTNSTIHAIATDTVTIEPLDGSPVNLGTYLIQDTTGNGVAQAFNILDNAVDTFDYLATPIAIARYPDGSEFVAYAWNGTNGNPGSAYVGHGIYIASTPTDTDGWADTVILHETGHWVSDMFTDDDNPGGSHVLRDNFQDPRLSYGEGYATFLCAQVREWRAPRLNGSGHPIDDHVSIYADIGIPPPLPAPGGLEFAYDFETALDGDGVPLGQIGTANETSVTSAMWDLVDGPSTPDESPGNDDEPGDESGRLSWQVLTEYMTTLRESGNPITVEDYYDGWFTTHGAGFMQAEVDSAFLGLAEMPFFADSIEPDDDFDDAPIVSPSVYDVSTGGGIVINEVDLSEEDRVELANTGTSPVDLTGWSVKTHRNDFPIDPTRVYVFSTFTLYPGEQVVIHEGGSPSDNSQTHLFGDAFSIPWINDDDGACILENGGGDALDFLRWDNVSGSDPNTTPTPPGTSWSGALLSPPLGKTLARDANGTDSDVAADFTEREPTLAAPNFDTASFHTIYPVGDVDLVRLDVAPGDLIVGRAVSPHSAGEPLLELLDAQGDLVGRTLRTHGISGESELQALIPGPESYSLRLSQAGPYTDYAPVNFLLYRMPEEAVLSPPVAFRATPENRADTGDVVELEWLNGAAYDSVAIRRDAVTIAILPGGATSQVDTADRGLYKYQVHGFVDTTATPAAAVRAFAGTVSCFFFDDLESGDGEFQLAFPWTLTDSIAAGGAWSLTDSPARDYGNNIRKSARIIVPTILLPAQTLEFDHICITEAGYDFGIVGISTDFGTTWTELARFDMDDHPGWSDGVADPGDWVHESIDLGAYVRAKVRVRFTIETDGGVTEDGWYIDNVAISNDSCTNAVAADLVLLPPEQHSLHRSYPNPFSENATIRFDLPAASRVNLRVYDVAGRLVRVLEGSQRAPGRHAAVWDGRDRTGQRVASGIYFYRLEVGSFHETRRMVRVR